MHSTDNLDDGYLGSGTHLWKSIKKYGKDQHVREVLEHLSTRKDLSNREMQIITAEVIKDPLCMNFRTGGTGNQPGRTSNEEVRAKMSASQLRRRANETDDQKAIRAASISKAVKQAYLREDSKKAQSDAAKKRWEDPKYQIACSRKGAKQTEESRMKMSIAKTGKTLIRTPEHNLKIKAAHRARWDKLIADGHQTRKGQLCQH